jgi:hypothetical protein
VPFEPRLSIRRNQTFLITCIGEPAFPQPGHEMVEGREASHELLDVLDIPDLANFCDSRDLVGVHFDAVLRDDVP